MKEYRQNVDHCFGCPNLRELRGRDMVIDWCRPQSRQVDKPVTGEIPSWCQLPEVRMIVYEEDLERKIGVILKDAIPHLDSEYVGIGGMSKLIERIMTEVKIHMVRSG